MNNSSLLIALALIAGAMIPFQSSMNAALGKALASPYFSALSVFAIAFLGLLLYIAAMRLTVPSGAQFAAAPGWSYLGGILGGTYILLIILVAPKLSIGTTTVMVLMGQVVAAMIIDQFGLLGAARHSINWMRALGVVLLVGGVYLVKKF